jgi:serine/threonine protein kinase
MSSISQYKKDFLIGHGTYSKVYLYTKLIETNDNNENSKIVVKKQKINEKEGVTPNILREISILKSVNDINIIELINVFNDRNKINIIMPHALFDLSHLRERDETYVKNNFKYIAYKLFYMLYVFYKNDLIHRDIKPQNILVFNSNDKNKYRFSMCDFGLSRLNISCDFDKKLTDTYSLWYRPPEILLGGLYSLSADVWAMGCVLLELYLGENLLQTRYSDYTEKSEIKQLERIFKVFGIPSERNYPKWDEERFGKIKKKRSLKKYILDEDLLDLFRSVFKYNNRIDIISILNHKYFNNISFQKNEIKEIKYIDRLRIRKKRYIEGGEIRINFNIRYDLFSYMFHMATKYSISHSSLFNAYSLLDKLFCISFRNMNLQRAIQNIMKRNGCLLEDGRTIDVKSNHPLVTNEKEKWKLISIVCLCLSTKIIDKEYVSYSQFISREEYKEIDLIELELAVLRVLNYEIFLVTMYNFFKIHTKKNNNMKENRLTLCFLFLSQISDNVFKYDIEDIVYSCIKMSNSAINTKSRKIIDIPIRLGKGDNGDYVNRKLENLIEDIKGYNYEYECHSVNNIINHCNFFANKMGYVSMTNILNLFKIYNET